MHLRFNLEMFTGRKEGKSLRPLPDGPNQHGLERAFGHQAFSKPPRSLGEQPTCGSGSFIKGLFWASCRHPGSLSMASRCCVQQPLPWGRVWTLLWPRSASRDPSHPPPVLSFGPPGPVFTLFLPSSLARTPKRRVPASRTVPPPQLPRLLSNLRPPPTWASRLEQQ